MPVSFHKKIMVCSREASCIFMVVLFVKPHEKSRVFVVSLLPIPDHMIKEWFKSTEQ